MGQPVHGRLYMQRGKAYDDLGEFQSALNDYESALHAAEDSGEPGGRMASTDRDCAAVVSPRLSSG